MIRWRLKTCQGDQIVKNVERSVDAVRCPSRMKRGNHVTSSEESWPVGGDRREHSRHRRTHRATSGATDIKLANDLALRHDRHRLQYGAHTGFYVVRSQGGCPYFDSTVRKLTLVFHIVTIRLCLRESYLQRGEKLTFQTPLGSSCWHQSCYPQQLPAQWFPSGSVCCGKTDAAGDRLPRSANLLHGN